jgi:hypothetical protein
MTLSRHLDLERAPETGCLITREAFLECGAGLKDGLERIRVRKAVGRLLVGIKR